MLLHINKYIPKKAIIKGLKTVKWYGRNQIIQKKPLIIFDVAHNEAGLRTFDNKNPFPVHYTRGGPWVDEWQDVESAQEWFNERDKYLSKKFR